MRITFPGERFHDIVGYNSIRIRNELIERALIPCEIGSLHRIGIGKALDATGPASQNAKKRGPKPVVVRLACVAFAAMIVECLMCGGCSSAAYDEAAK